MELSVQHRGAVLTANICSTQGNIAETKKYNRTCDVSVGMLLSCVCMWMCVCVAAQLTDTVPFCAHAAAKCASYNEQRQLKILSCYLALYSTVGLRSKNSVFVQI